MESLESQLSNGMHNSDFPTNYQIMVFWYAPVLYIRLVQSKCTPNGNSHFRDLDDRRN